MAERLLQDYIISLIDANSMSAGTPAANELPPPEFGFEEKLKAWDNKHAFVIVWSKLNL